MSKPVRTRMAAIVAVGVLSMLSVGADRRASAVSSRGSTFLVTTTSDSGPGSLTQAILDANAHRNESGPDVVRFNLPGSGPHAIALEAPLPTITDPVVVDGYSQPGALANTLADGSDAVLMVEIDGSRLRGPADGLLVIAGSSTVRGLWIHGFGGDAIRLEGGGSNTIEGNRLGCAEANRATSNAGSGIVIVDSAGNVIGGSAPAARNLIEWNATLGVRVVGARAIGNAISGNSIVGNDGGGIDLESDAPALPAGRGRGPNNLQPAPVLESVSFSKAGPDRATEAVIEGSLEGLPSTTYRLEVFATRARPHARAILAPEGERFLTSAQVTTGEDGTVDYQIHLPTGVRSRDSVTATATDPDGNTSEFSPAVLAPTLVISWNVGTGNWGTPGNWSPPQVPTATDDVVIAANGANTTFTVTVNVAASANGLTLGGGSGIQTLAMAAQTLTLNATSTVNSNGVLALSGSTLGGTGNLTIDGTFNWSGGVMTGAAATTVNGTFNLSGLVGINGNRTLTNASTANWTAGVNQGMWTGTGSVINNNGTWDAQVNGGAIVNQYGGVTTFNNSGTFKKSAGTGSTLMNIPFVNTGTVDVQSGTISLGGGGSNTNALTVSAASSTLRFAAGTFDLNAGTTFSGPGTISLNSTGTVNVNTAISFPAGTTFHFANGTLAGTGAVTTNGTFNWSGGLMTGAATTTVNGTFNLSGLPGINNSRTLTCTGTTNWTAGVNLGLWTGTGSVINNSGTWDAQVDGGAIVNHYGGATTFNNSGTFKKSAGAGGIFMDIPFVNTGTLDVQSGTISLRGGGSNTNVLKATAVSSTLVFAAGTFDLNTGTTFSGPGTISLNSTGTVNVNTAISFPAGTTFHFANGTLAGTGGVTTNGTFNWSGGLMTGATTTTVNGTFNLSGLPGINGGRTLNCTGTTNWTAGVNLGLWTGTGSVINNSGTWDAQVNGGAIVNRYGGATTFNNSGTFKKSAGSGGIFLDIPFVNTGTVDVQSGAISLRGGGSNTNALSVSGASSTLIITAGVFDLNAGTTFSGPGTVTFNSTGTLNANSAVSFPASTTFSFVGGTLAGTGNVTTNGTFNWSGGLMTGAATTTSNGTLNLSGLPGINNGRTLTCTGTTNWTAGVNLGLWTGTGSVINNSGTWDAQVDGGAIVNHYGGATSFNNTGTFKKSAGAGTTSVSISFTNSGTVDAQSGTLNMSSSSYTQTAGTTRLSGGAFTSTTNVNIQGGTLAGSGTVTGPVIVSGTGALAPGLAGAGTLNLVGNYTQQAPNGAFNVEIGGLSAGTQFDRVNVSGAASAATLAGILNVSLISGFVPAPGDSFTIMTYPSRTGTYTLNLPTNVCIGWQVSYGPTALILTALAVPAEVTGLVALPNKVGLSWDPAPIRAGTTYNVLRGDLDKLPVGPGADETCVAPSTPDTTASDATTPAQSRGFWYLVREQVSGCGIGTYGFATSGAERISTACP